MHDACGRTNSRRVRRHVVDHYSVGANPRAVADGDRAQDLRAGADGHTIADDRSAIIERPAPATAQPDSHPGVDTAFAADLHVAVDDDVPVRDHEARSDDHLPADCDVPDSVAHEIAEVGQDRHPTPEQAIAQPEEQDGQKRHAQE